jgi:hypothetical protein
VGNDKNKNNNGLARKKGTLLRSCRASKGYSIRHLSPGLKLWGFLRNRIKKTIALTEVNAMEKRRVVMKPNVNASLSGDSIQKADCFLLLFIG